MKDYYRILQVDRSAEQEVIDAAYRRLARKYHPDNNRSADAARRMQEINKAYEVLRDPIKRKEHDRHIGTAETHGGGFADRAPSPPRSSVQTITFKPYYNDKFSVDLQAALDAYFYYGTPLSEAVRARLISVWQKLGPGMDFDAWLASLHPRPMTIPRMPSSYRGRR